MERQRYVENGENSFYGKWLYDQIVPADRLLRKLIRLYKGEGVVSRPPFDPAQALKVELVAYLYHLSERQVEVYINENLPAKYFVGLAVDQKAADHSTLTVLRERLLQRGRLKVFEEMLAEIIRIARQNGVQFGSIQIVEGVHSVANVNTAKDKRQGKGCMTRMPNGVSSASARSGPKKAGRSSKPNTSTAAKPMSA